MRAEIEQASLALPRSQRPERLTQAGQPRRRSGAAIGCGQRSGMQGDPRDAGIPQPSRDIFGSEVIDRPIVGAADHQRLPVVGGDRARRGNTLRARVVRYAGGQGRGY